jgi:hypothetical protein
MVVERFMHLFHRAKGPLYFAFGSGSDATAIFAPGQMRPRLHAEITHDLLKHLAAGNRPPVHIQQTRDPLKWETRDRFLRHGGKQKAQGGLHVLAVHAVVFLIRHSTAVIDDTIQHQLGMAPPLLHPR